MLGLIRNLNLVPYNLDLDLHVYLNFFLKKKILIKCFYIISLKVNERLFLQLQSPSICNILFTYGFRMYKSISLKHKEKLGVLKI